MKKYFKTILICILVFSLTGCGKEDKISVIDEEAANTIDIYYQDGDQVVKDKEKYQLKQPDSVSASLEEVMAVIVTKIDTRLEYHTYMIDADNNVVLEFVLTEEMAKEELLLTKASITETLFQIEGINSIKIKIMDKEGSILDDALYLPDSFYFYDIIP